MALTHPFVSSERSSCADFKAHKNASGVCCTATCSSNLRGRVDEGWGDGKRGGRGYYEGYYEGVLEEGYDKRGRG